MPSRATKRGADRTPLSGSYDVLICGASFAGLAVAREVSNSSRRRRVLMVDRYAVGERQTSACAAPTAWLANMGLAGAIRQSFRDIVIHTPRRTFRWTLPWSFATFDYPQLCGLLRAQSPDVEFETATVQRREGDIVITDRGELTAPLIVDALGWRRVLSNSAEPIQPPAARMSRGLEVRSGGESPDLELWLDPRYVPAGYAWSFPAGDELRIGVGSFDPRRKVREPTVRLAGALGVEPDGYHGNWIPHQMRDPVEDGVFFVGDSAGHCIPATAEGIRTAFYFGLACGRELRAALDGSSSRVEALARYGSFCEERRRVYDWLLKTQSLISAVNPRPRAMTCVVRAMDDPRFLVWSFGRYLRIAPPEYALGR